MYNNNNTHERGLRNHNHPGTAPNMHGAGPHQQPPTGITYGQSPASGPAPTTAGHHKHDLFNKLDPRIDSTHDRQPMSQTGGSNVPEGTYGPHSSRLANALDPRVDSDLDSARAGAGMGAGGGLGGTQTAAAVPGAVPGGGAGMGMGGGMMGAGAGAGAGYGGAHRGHGGVEAAEGTYGPHGSRMANAMDPRVDSDRDRHVGPGATHAPGGGVMGGHGAVGGAPGHGAMGNTSTATAAGGAGAGVGAPHTAGPHKSDLLNKLDPRVDSQTGAFKGGSGTRGGY